VNHRKGVDCEMRVTLPATLDAIELFFVEFGRRSRALLVRQNCFLAELLVREALTNAVVHGCGEDPDKQVRCFLRLRAGRLLIAVADDGAGFDWRAARGNRARLPDSSGRGMEILHRYASHVRFNEKGNVVAMIKQLERGNAND
jgi:serine/threonine-protein kinase RsbW